MGCNDPAVDESPLTSTVEHKERCSYQKTQQKNALLEADLMAAAVRKLERHGGPLTDADS